VETGLALEEEDRAPGEGAAEWYKALWRAARMEGEGLFLAGSSLRLRLDAHMLLEVRGEDTGLLQLLPLFPAPLPRSVDLRRMNGDVEPAEEEAQEERSGALTRSGASALDSPTVSICPPINNNNNNNKRIYYMQMRTVFVVVVVCLFVCL